MKLFLKILIFIVMLGSFTIKASDCNEDQRLFKHKLLATAPLCIPKNPQRIIALDMGAVEMTLLSDRQLLGTANWLLAESSVLNPEFSEILPNVENVGYPASLEKLVQLKPDIIFAVGSGVGVNRSIDEIAAQKIAPTVLAKPSIYDDWKLSSEFWASALNESALFDELLKNYQKRIDEVKVALGDKVTQTVSIMASSTYGNSLWLKDTPPAAVVNDVGLLRPDAQNYDKNSAKAIYKDVRYPIISDERLDLADADNIFVFSYPSHDKKGQKKHSDILNKLKKNPIWQSLNGAKKGNIFYVDGHWWRCNSYSLANRVLDDIAIHLTGTVISTKTLSYPLDK